MNLRKSSIGLLGTLAAGAIIPGCIEEIYDSYYNARIENINKKRLERYAGDKALLENLDRGRYSKKSNVNIEKHECFSLDFGVKAPGCLASSFFNYTVNKEGCISNIENTNSTDICKDGRIYFFFSWDIPHGNRHNAPWTTETRADVNVVNKKTGGSVAFITHSSKIKPSSSLGGYERIGEILVLKTEINEPGFYEVGAMSCRTDMRGNALSDKKEARHYLCVGER